MNEWLENDAFRCLLEHGKVNSPHVTISCWLSGRIER